MGFRSFIKATAKALGLAIGPSKVTQSDNVDFTSAFERLEEEITEALRQGDSLRLLDVWHEVALWRSPPPRAELLKVRLSQLLEEFENKQINPQASASVILFQRSLVASERRVERDASDSDQKLEAERLTREAAAKRQAEDEKKKNEWSQQKQKDQRIKQQQARQQAEAQQHQQELDRLAQEAKARHAAEEEAARRAAEEAARLAEQQRLQEEQARKQAEAQQRQEELDRLAQEAKARHAAEEEAARRAAEEAARLAEQQRLQEEQARQQAEAQHSSITDFIDDDLQDLDPLFEDLITGDESALPSANENKKQTCEKPDWFDNKIDDLLLTRRAQNSLYYNGFKTIGDLAGKTADDLLRLKNFGQRSLDELLASLEKNNIPFPISENQDWWQPDKEIAPVSKTKRAIRPNPTLPLSEARVPQSALGPLQRSGIKILADLAGKTEQDLHNIRNLGPKNIELIRAALQTYDLDLPFQISELEIHSPPAQAAADDDREIQATQSESEKANKQQVVDLVKDSITASLGKNEDPSNFLDTLLQNTILQISKENLYSEVYILRELLFVLDSIYNTALTSGIQKLTWKVVKQSLLLRYNDELGKDSSHIWIRSLQKSIKQDRERGWSAFIDKSCGSTYQSIGDKLDPPITRERVRQLLKKVGGVIGKSADQISEQIKDAAREIEKGSKSKIIDNWIKHFGRLPFKGDRIDEKEHSDLLQDVLSKNPKQRLEVYEELSIIVPDLEWDIHYQWMTGGNAGMGNGYWKDFECLKQCIYRHAIALGEPNLMPKQTTLPRRVGAIVQNFGGQSKVARRLGLAYQGQLVGEDGRTYWTEERLMKLLDDVNIFIGQDISLMPSYAQIYDFFAAQVNEPYAGKNPGSSIASMTRQGKLHWSEVAARFNKVFVTGSSTSAITIAYIKAFVRDLGEHLEALTPSELFVLFQAQGISRGDKEKFSRTFDRLVDAVQSGMVKRVDLHAWAKNHDVQSINQLLEFGAELKAVTNQSDKESRLLEQRSKQIQQEFTGKSQADLISSEDLPEIDAEKALLALDKAASVIESSATDADRIEFLKAKATAKLWDACFKDESKLTEQLRAMNAQADTYSCEVRAAFLDEYDGARNLEVPASYQFCDFKGRPRQPKLMQRLVAYRLKRDFRLLNLSGTGTGKTLSAVLAAQVCKSKRILVSCPNGVIPSWVRTFNSAYPGAKLHVKPNNWELPNLDDETHVIIVNHERFQNMYRQQILEFCLGFQADLVVIDEIHQAKQRDRDSSSQRRELMDLFVFTSGNLNDQLRVLGLSATPVINNLLEGRSLIELVSQEPVDGVNRENGLSTCMNLYQHFVVHGIRMNPGQLPRTELSLVDVDATHILPQIVSATRCGGFHDVEQLLVQPKLNALKECLEPGEKTVIFVTYIKNTLDPLCAWLDQHGYSFSVYTGGEKEAKEAGFSDSLDEFIRGSSDVLVATIQCAGTGVDGLQTACNRAVFLQLPWTSTEFEQAIGRLDRDGTEFSSVKIYLPITDIHLPNGERWSWCRSKLDRIRSKRDIAKAAVDGEVPDEATLITPTKASEYWLQWLKRLETQVD